MKNMISLLIICSMGCLLVSQKIVAQDNSIETSDNTWKSPDEDILKILHALQL